MCSHINLIQFFMCRVNKDKIMAGIYFILSTNIYEMANI